MDSPSPPAVSAKRSHAEWLLLAFLPFALASQWKLVRNPAFHVTWGMSRADVASCFLQSLVLWCALYAVLAPLVRRSPMGPARRGVVVAAVVTANLALLLQLLDARTKVLFLQPLTWGNIEQVFREIRVAWSSLPLFAPRRFVIGVVLTLLGFNAAVSVPWLLGLLGARGAGVGASAAWLGRAGPAPRYAFAGGVALALLSVAARPQPYHLDDNLLTAPLLGVARKVLVHRGIAEDLSAACDAKAATPGPSEMAFAGTDRVAPARGYNIVLFIGESVGYRWSSLGDPAHDATPLLRALAAEGPLTTRARAQFALSTKAIYGILSGRYSSPSLEIVESECEHLDALPRTLARAGYYSAIYSTQYFAWQNTRAQYTAMGFQRVAGAEWFVEQAHARGEPDPPGNSWVVDDRELLKGPVDALPSDRPFFAVFYNGASHHPYDFPGQTTDGADYDRYLRALRYGDDVMEKLLAQLKARGLYERTLFVFVGDHGEQFTNGLFKARGCGLSEAEHVVPLIFAIPGYAARGGARLPGAGSVEGARQIDLAPTVLDLVGVLPDTPIQGRSLLVDVAGEPPPTYLNSYGSCDAAALVTGHVKQVLDRHTERVWAFDLAADPAEDRPLPVDLDAHPALARRLKACADYDEARLRERMRK